MIIIEDNVKPLHPDDDVDRLPNDHLGSATPSTYYTRISYHAAARPAAPPPPPPFSSYPEPPYAAPPITVLATRYRETPLRRFWKAFAFALLLYLALLSLSRTIVIMASGAHDAGTAVGAPRASDGAIQHAIGRGDWDTYRPRPPWAPSFPESAETSLTLPVGARELYLVARGAYQTGRVDVVQSAERGDAVRVDVRVAYHTARALARARVCRLRRHEGGHGVGIYTPETGPPWPDWSSQLYVEVVLTLPAAPSAAAPLRIPALSTDTHNFAQTVGDLWESVLFETLALATSNARVQVDAVTLTEGSITTSNGAIAGHANVSRALVLRTSNGAIQATASLLHRGGDATRLEMHTSNGPIVAGVSLATAAGAGGRFDVAARTSNGAATVRYDDAPLGARLRSQVRTSNGPAAVGMHPAYEGRYAVSTSNARAVVRDTQPADPAGEGRRRVVTQTRASAKAAVDGRVYWEGPGEGGRGEGSTTTVETSNGRASLDV